MAVIVKFKVNAITDYGGSKSVSASAIYGKEGENADFAKATPSGTFQMNIDNSTKAADFFKPGKEFYIFCKEERD